MTPFGFFLSPEISYLSGVPSVSVFIGLNVKHVSNSFSVTDRQMLISKSHLTLSVFGLCVCKGTVTKQSINWCHQLASSPSQCLSVPSPEKYCLHGVIGVANILDLDQGADEHS